MLSLIYPSDAGVSMISTTMMCNISSNLFMKTQITSLMNFSISSKQTDSFLYTTLHYTTLHYTTLHYTRNLLVPGPAASSCNTSLSSAMNLCVLNILVAWCNSIPRSLASLMKSPRMNKQLAGNIGAPNEVLRLANPSLSFMDNAPPPLEFSLLMGLFWAQLSEACNSESSPDLRSLDLYLLLFLSRPYSFPSS